MLLSKIDPKMQAGGPAFSAYNTNVQNVTNAVYTKVNLDTEDFDTDNCFATGRFTPTVPGYYQINGTVYGYGGSTATVISVLYKNGTAYHAGSFGNANTATNGISTVAGLIYFNGTTDYVELYCYVNATTSPNLPAMNAGIGTRLSGFFVRG